MLNVKNPEAYRLARAIADQTGDSLTKVVIDSLRARHEAMEKKRKKATLEEVLAIADRVSSHIKRPYQDHGDLLYDEHGLPK